MPPSPDQPLFGRTKEIDRRARARAEPPLLGVFLSVDPGWFEATWYSPKPPSRPGIIRACVAWLADKLTTWTHLCRQVFRTSARPRPSGVHSDDDPTRAPRISRLEQRQPPLAWP